MATGMHLRDILAVVFAPGFGSKRHPCPLKHRQAIHIGTQRDHRTRLATHQRANDAGVCDAGLDLVEPDVAKMFSDFRRSFELTIREFGILMDVSSPFDDFWLDGRKGIVQI
jgi:hypothetical protein